MTKSCAVNLENLGCRKATLFIGVAKGKADETAEMLLKSSSVNVTSVTTRIGHPRVDVMVEIIYRDSEELYRAIESVRVMPNVSSVEWAETVKKLGNSHSAVLDKMLKPGLP